MVKSCCVYGCKEKFVKDSGIHFFSFPFKRPEILKKWVLAIKRKDFEPKAHHWVCSVHFELEDFQHNPGSNRKLLKEHAVPSIFPGFPEYYQPKPKKSRSSKTSLELLKPPSPPTPSEDNNSEVLLIDVEMEHPCEKGCQITPTVSDKEVQTLAVALPKSTKQYRKKIRILSQKLRRKNSKIQNLKQLVKQLNNAGLVDDHLDQLLLDNFEGMSLEIFKNVKTNRRRHRKGHRYSQEIKKFALTLYYNSPKAYKYCRDILQLPDPSSLSNWISNVDAEPGFFRNVFDSLKHFKSKDVNLVLDGMAIRKQIIWDDAAKKAVGYVDYGENVCYPKEDEPASEALVFMLVSLRESWKWPIGYFLQNKSDSTMQKNLIKSAIELSTEAGLNVHGVTFDGTATNFATAQSLGCSTRGELSELNSLFKIGDQSIHVIPDACRMLKLSRNCIGTLKVLESPQGTVNWSYIEKLYDLQSGLGLKFANKLSRAHVDWTKNKMKVKLAAQTLSSSTATALEFLENSGIEEFQGAGPTIHFLILGKGFKSPLRLQNISMWENEMKEALNYLFSLKTYEGTPLFLSKRKTFIIGFALAINSVLAIAKTLLKDSKSGFKYLLTYKFSQDHLETFFSKIRQRHGFNNNPNVLQLKYALKQILLKNEITPSPSGNSLLIENDPSGNIFEIQWNKKKKFDITDEEDPSSNNEDLNEDFTHYLLDETSVLEENILYYIGGFIVKKIFHKINCESCKESVLMSHNDHNYSCSGPFADFTRLKNKGGLVRASSDVLKVIKMTEKILGTETQQFSHL